MNLKINKESICFKISKDELPLLLSGESLNENIELGNNKFIINILPIEKPDMFYSEIGVGNITLFISKNKIQELKYMGKDKKGLEVRQETLKISFQIDIKSLKNIEKNTKNNSW